MVVEELHSCTAVLNDRPSFRFMPFDASLANKNPQNALTSNL
jgi:hypothetical protein